MDFEFALSMLESKDTKQGYEALKELESISESSNILYLYMDKFIDMIGSEKYVIRVRGIRLFCKQAKWDVDNIINKNIETALTILNDEKPTVLRQALSALKEIVLYKPELDYVIKKHVLAIDYLKYKDSMQSLICRDIEELVRVIERVK